MIHIFKMPNDATYMVELCDVGLSESPINFYMPDKDSHVRLEVGSSGWYFLLCILDLVDDDAEHRLEEHEPIAGLVAALHWACIAEPIAMGVEI